MPGSLTLLIGIILFLVGSVVGVVGWIMALIKTAQIGRWGWFVAVFLLSVLSALIYGGAGPAERAQA
jgi:hypothetical protein